MRLTVIGCSGSFPGPDSPSSCYLAEAEGFRLVIDMGNGALGVLQRYAELFGIDAICVSHLHADHCVDLGSYWIAREFVPGGPKPPIPVYGPPGTAARVAPFLGPSSDRPAPANPPPASTAPASLRTAGKCRRSRFHCALARWATPASTRSGRAAPAA